jgi:cytochrome c oxidase subunit 2
MFLANGCGGCHRVRGTPAQGVIGPDLTHVGSRLSLGAGILSADHQGFSDWLARHQHLKPENRMPPYEILSDAELATLAAYLVALK